MSKHQHYHHNHGIGGNSTRFLNANDTISSLKLSPGAVFLDVGCGIGAYSVAAAQMVGSNGHVYAIDLWDEGIKELKSNATKLGLSNISAFLGNAAEKIPIPDHSVDFAFMSFVFHDVVQDKRGTAVLNEIVRVLKPSGTLTFLEWKPEAERPPGPPASIRLSSSQLEKILSPFGFQTQELQDLNKYHYLLKCILKLQ